MNANDHDREKRLDEYIDALNAGRSAPQADDDAELADLFTTARDLHRLRAAESTHDDVPSRVAAALERELRANPTHGTRRIESNDMSLFRDASSNGTLRPPEDASASYVTPQRPERARQWAQFVAAAVAFIVIGVVLAQIIGGGAGDEPGSAVGTDPGGTPTSDVAASEEAISTPAILTPTVAAPAIAPTPDESGVIIVQTFDEARELTPFELVESETLPPSMELVGFELFTAASNPSTPGTTSDAAVDLVNAYYRYGTSGAVVNFIQTTRGCSDTSTETVAYDDIEVGERTVRRGLGTHANGQPLASYRWQSGEVCLNVVAPLLDGVDEELLASFVSAIPTPEVTATPEIGVTPPVLSSQPTTEPVAGESRPVLTLTMDYVTCDDTVIAYGAAFEPGSTITIYGGQLIGDSFAPIVAEQPVADDGTFEVELNLLRLMSDCALGAEVTEGSQFLLSADTGSSLVKDGGVEEGPSATTVLSFSSTVPEVVKHREQLPSCGVEVQRNETMMGWAFGPDEAMRECFANAVESGALAEFVSYQQMPEGHMITAIHRSIGDGNVDMLVDGTQDPVESRGWLRSICVWNEMSNLEPFTFHWHSCSEPVTIE